MPAEAEPIYPDCPTVIRAITIGGLTKAELLKQLRQAAIALNESADQLFASDHFTTAETRRSCTTIELTIRDLGFPQGATTADIEAKAAALGLDRCPLKPPACVHPSTPNSNCTALPARMSP